MRFLHQSYSHQLLVVPFGHYLLLLQKVCILILGFFPNFCSDIHTTSSHFIQKLFATEGVKLGFLKYFLDSFVEEDLFWLGELVRDSEMPCPIPDLGTGLLGDIVWLISPVGVLFSPSVM